MNNKKKKKSKRDENLLADREHLLFPMLVVVHLGALGQSFISHLGRKQSDEICAHTCSGCLVTELTEVSLAAGTPTPPKDG